jgi:heme/copper-type cytochrome/quinol oxidase subunit 3
MSEATATPPAGLNADMEEAGFYHECALNGSWTASRLAIGGLSFLFGSFLFAYFYLRSLNSGGRWEGSGYHAPSMIMGTVMMLMILISAGINYAGVQRIKAGHKKTWQIGAVIALLLGLATISMQIFQLLNLPFYPGSSGFASVFVGFYPVFIIVVLSAMIWLETLLARSRFIPGIAFVEQPPTYTEAFTVQRFQASVSGFTAIWNYLAVIAILFWFLFYVI